MTDAPKPELLPCPFCGAGQSEFRENGRTWMGGRYSEPTSVSVMHWCEEVPGQPSRVIQRVGRARESAVAAWNLRAPHPEITDAERWRYIRRNLCLSGNGDGTCAMQALNLPASIVGWPEPGEAADFCDAAIDAAIREERSRQCL